MLLKKLLIHELEKKAQVTGATLVCSNKCLDANEQKPQSLNKKLIESFSIARSRVDYAVFQTGEDFPKSLKTYLATGQGDDDFITFSSDVVTRLKDQITNIAPAKGGYLVFSEYISQGKMFIAVFLVRDTLGEFFTHEKDFYGIGEITYADTSKLAMACRINIATFQNSDGKSLLIINKRSKEVSEYFSRWIGASDRESSEEYTNQLYRIISRVQTPVNPDSPTQERFTIDETRKKVHDLIKVESQGMANVNTISLTVYGDEDLLSKYIEDEGIELPTEFRTYSGSLKKFVQIRVNKDGILLQFSKGDSSKVTLSENGDAVIISSKAIVDEVRQQMNQING